MYGIFTYIYHIFTIKNQPIVGKYTIHGWYGLSDFWVKTQFYPTWGYEKKLVKLDL